MAHTSTPGATTRCFPFRVDSLPWADFPNSNRTRPDNKEKTFTYEQQFMTFE